MTYPVQFSIDVPKQPLNRISTGFRIFYAIPIIIILLLISGGLEINYRNSVINIISGGDVIYFPPMLMILFRQKYPRWWFDWNIAWINFFYRVLAYLLLMTDQYPSTDETQSVHTVIPYPNAKKGLSRWLQLVKFVLVIPHIFILFALYLSSLFLLPIVWFFILSTGKYPAPIFRYFSGIMGWSVRVTAYAFILATDKYPPFNF